jgi:hypothetical protein
MFTNVLDTFIHSFIQNKGTDMCNICLYITYLNPGTCIYHTPGPILRLCKYGIARPCIYFDVTSLALYKHSVQTR